MIQFWQNLVANGRTDGRTDGREWFHWLLSDWLRASKCNKNRTDENWSNYKKQRNLRYILRKTKKQYFNNLNIKTSLTERKFWKNIEPFFQIKACTLTPWCWLKNIITDGKEIASIMNTYFINTTENLGLKRNLIHTSKH